MPNHGMRVVSNGTINSLAGNQHPSNQRIREVGGAIAPGVIDSIEGSGSQGYGGDAGLSTEATLNAPRSVVPDALGTVGTQIATFRSMAKGLEDWTSRGVPGGSANFCLEDLVNSKSGASLELQARGKLR